MNLIILFLYPILLTSKAEDVIYRLDPKDYYRMPLKYHIDHVGPCQSQSSDVYCTANADVVSDKPNDLLDMMKRYSAHESTHFNYTNIKYGLCITTTCKQFYNGDDSNSALWNTTEACLNDSFSRKHDLKVRLTDLDCYRHGHTFDLDFVDRAILLLLGAILALNVVGSLYDYLRDETKPANSYLVLFSVRSSWRSLVAPPSPDPRLAQLRCLNGIRAVCSLLIIFGHFLMPIVVNSVSNPEDYESFHLYTVSYLIHNGAMVTGTFFTVSGFLLAYNMENKAKKHGTHWTDLLKNTRSRWLRLTPTHLVVLMITIVWYKFITIGPLFKDFILREATDCRKYGLYNIFYLANAIDFSDCNIHVWHIGADFQLHIIGLAIVVLSPSKRVRNWALLALGLAGVTWPAYVIYTNDLDGTFLPTPTAINKSFRSIVTFERIYKPTITNAPMFVVGMAFGFLVYWMQENNLTTRNYRKYRVVYWVVIVLYFLNIMTGGIFFLDGPRPPLLVRVLYTPIVKPLMGLITSLIILGAVCKCEDGARGFFEWNFWTPVFRLSYCVYLTHPHLVRYTAGTSKTLYFVTAFNVLRDSIGITVFSLILGLVIHLLVELPFSGLFDLLLSSDKSSKSEGEAKTMFKKSQNAFKTE